MDVEKIIDLLREALEEKDWELIKELIELSDPNISEKTILIGKGSVFSYRPKIGNKIKK